MSDTYCYQLLRANDNHNLGLLALIGEGDGYPGQLWGAFTGLFGIASNEIVTVSRIAERDDGEQPSAAVKEYWRATARPTDFKPLRREGLYVFRRFIVRFADIEEVVALSSAAWRTFEASDTYDTEPLGLFRPELPENAAADSLVSMTLLTWYDSFVSWEKSRRPHADAAAGFKRRHALTRSTNAVATRLVRN